MRFLPTRVHGMIDYAWGVLLLALPWVAGFANDRAAFWIASVFGIGAILYSLLTDYELGLAKVIPVPTHLMLDALAGVVLAALALTLVDGSTARWWLAGAGAFAVIASLTTELRPR